MVMARLWIQVVLAGSMAACSLPAWKETGWLSEDFLRLVDAYFPGYRVFEQDVETLNRNLHWYTATAFLEDGGERPLSSPRYEGVNVVRFTWLGAFGEYLCVRVREEGGRILLETRSDFKAPWIRKEVVAAAWQELRRAQAELLAMPAREGGGGVDGGWWILEIKQGGRAWHAERWSPEGTFRTYCDLLARLAEPPQAPY